MLLNDPFVIQQSKLWAGQVTAAFQDPKDRVVAMYQRLLGRHPSDEEIHSGLLLVNQLSSDASQQEAWEVLAHAMFNMKEAWYIK
jgi:hypothetical protein